MIQRKHVNTDTQNNVKPHVNISRTDSLKYWSHGFVVKNEAKDLRARSLYLGGFFVLFCFTSSIFADLSNTLKS